MSRIIWLLLFVAAASVSSAQQATPSAEHTTTIQLQAKTPSNDPATLVSSISGSYYHPDSMASLDCDIAVDWPAFFSSVKTEIPPERLKTIQGVKMRMKAERGKTAVVTFDWAGGALNGGQEQFENGLKQVVGGFFESYWPMAATTLIANPSEITKSEPISGGGMKVYTSGPGENLVMDVDKDYTPTHFVLDTPALKATIDLQYLPSPEPVPGDLRRISRVDVAEHIGTSNMNGGFGLDYQAVNEFIVPKHVLFSVPGAYSINMELSGCTANKNTAVHETKQK